MIHWQYLSNYNLFILAIILAPLKSNIEVGLHSNNELRIDECE